VEEGAMTGRDEDQDGAVAGGAGRGVVASAAGLVALAVVLYGGYVEGWEWTGFGDNDTLWDWLELLLLPVVVAALPIWLSKSHLMRAGRRRAFGAGFASFSALVLVGYLAPLTWTGFVGNTLWDWLQLLVLPVVLVVLPVLAADAGFVRPRHRVAAGLAAAALVAAVLGGYLGDWGWTGFRGNTLWDWIQLALLPLIVPTLLTPRAVGWISAGVADAEAAWDGAQDRREARRRAATPAEPYVGRRGRVVLVVLAVLLAVGIVGGHAAVRHRTADTPAPERAAVTPRGSAAADCAQPGGTVAAGTEARVVRVGARFTACWSRGPAVVLGTTRGASGPGAFALMGRRIAWADDRCGAGAAPRCTSRVEILRVGDAHPFLRRSFTATGGIAGVGLDAAGALAVMVRPGCAAAPCAGGRVVLLDGRGATVAAEGADVDAGSLAVRGRTVFWLQQGAAASAQLSA
jgi:hypothetical protein